MFRIHSRFILWNLLVLAFISSILFYFLTHSVRDLLKSVLPPDAADSTLVQLEWRLIFAVLIGVAVTLIFGYFVRGLISKPLRDIASVSRKLAAGDLQQRLPISGDEEIAALGNALNTMAKHLSMQMQELSEGKQRLELIVGAMSDGVMVLDSAGSASLTNRALQEILGTDRSFIGQTPLEIFRLPELEDSVRAVLKGEPGKVVEIALANGRILQANVAPVANESGIVDAVVVVFHDLTEIRRIERMRRDFVANVSHEFKTPLTSIRGYAETLLSGALYDRKSAPDFVRVIERNAQQLETLVRDLLTLAKLEAELPALRELVNVRSVVEDLVASRQAVLAERGISVANDCPPVEIHADVARLRTAVSNLVDNAINYNRPKGEIRINGSVDKSVFQLAIADTGTGIPADELPRIFERFYRVDKARSRESGGTGLGLAIVKHAIESQGGSISVTSRLGAGSTFTIKLPSNGREEAAS